MGQRTLDGTDVTALRQRYRDTVFRDLPAAAREGEGWPVTEDHCFARIVLDAVFEDVWYDHVDGEPAYEHLSPAELRRAISVAEAMLERGPAHAAALNRASLRYRGEA